MKLISGVYWDRGGRSVNQDSIVLEQVGTSRGRMLMAVVCDGIGGLSEGENASGYVTERVMEHFYGKLLALAERNKGKKAFARSFLRCLTEIRQELQRYANEREIRMGSTLSLLLLWKRRYLLVQLGDSRIYEIRRKKLRLLTVDHSDGNNALTKCIGSFPYQAPDVRSGRIWGKCGFLICSDGFYRKQDRESFGLLIPSEVSDEEQAGRRLAEMAKLARQRGEMDNLSAVYVKVC